jgi:hypothetical protein
VYAQAFIKRFIIFLDAEIYKMSEDPAVFDGKLFDHFQVPLITFKFATCLRTFIARNFSWITVWPARVGAFATWLVCLKAESASFFILPHVAVSAYHMHAARIMHLARRLGNPRIPIFQSSTCYSERKEEGKDLIVIAIFFGENLDNFDKQAKFFLELVVQPWRIINRRGQFFVFIMVGASQYFEQRWRWWVDSIVENYPHLCTTIVNKRKVCVDNNQQTRAHQS